MIIAGQFVVPYLPLVSPHPIVTGYIGYYAGVLALCLIPMILLVRFGFGIVWSHKFDPKIRRMLLGAWLVTIIVFATTLIFGARNFAFHGRTTSGLYNGPISSDKPLVINVENLNSESFDDRIQLRLGHSRLHNGNLYVAHGINFRLEPSQDSTLQIDIVDNSRGSSPRRAKNNTQLIKHKASIEENTINIDEFYSIPRKSLFRGQYRNIEMNIPIGQEVVLQGSTHPYNWHDFKDESPYDTKNWVMTEDGLVAIADESSTE